MVLIWSGFRNDHLHDSPGVPHKHKTGEEHNQRSQKKAFTESPTPFVIPSITHFSKGSKTNDTTQIVEKKSAFAYIWVALELKRRVSEMSIIDTPIRFTQSQ